ncbi:hypothetical protein MAA8898_00661 [Maliponia aquimaris]|uniref:Uncharacterized protein n=1 Tax=Maliponia aquimaris TaxID=1673631 RepID=A0A238JYU5_9RHOB|nr:hypothetical protein MAA8898_00661 [Maliponia aquimaris]
MRMSNYVMADARAKRALTPDDEVPKGNPRKRAAKDRG